jgi:hypothetical protein
MWSLTSLRTKRIRSFRKFRLLPPKDFFEHRSFASFPRCQLRAHFSAEPTSSAGPATSENANGRHRACGELLRNNHTPNEIDGLMPCLISSSHGSALIAGRV